jgi:hypothetical protein
MRGNNGPLRWIKEWHEISPRLFWFKLTCGHIVMRKITNFHEFNDYTEYHQARCHVCKELQRRQMWIGEN